MTEKQRKQDQLAREILTLARNTLLVNLRFLDAALSQFQWEPIETGTLMTDGKYILYNPHHVLSSYQCTKEIPVRDYLHIVLHCVFRHMYLDINKDDFYRIETTVDGKNFVTARGWSDLSDMIRLYEQNGLAVDELLVAQYLQNHKIAKNFAIYYDLFNKYKSDYQVPTILDGKASDDIKERAKSAKFDERLALLGLLLDAVIAELRSVNLAELSLAELLTSLKVARVELAKSGSEPANAVQKQIDLLSKKIVNGKRASTLSTDDEYACYSTIAVLKDMVSILHKKSPISGIEAFKQLKTEFDKRSKTLKQQADTAGQELSNVFRFCEEVFDEGQELLILVTELTISRYGAHFISRYGCDEYFAHNKELVFYERQKEIIKEIENLEWEE